jgi:putative endonuclease
VNGYEEEVVVRNTRELGDLGEQIAGAFLNLKGYRVIGRKYRYAGREIDLLVRHGCYLIAVEVKLRRSSQFGRAVEAVDGRKLARIQFALSGALSHTVEPVTPRVDLVVIDMNERLDEMMVKHIEAVY